MTMHLDARLPLIADSYKRLTGQDLIPSGGDVASALWELPRVILAHGTQADPIFFYGNRMALELFELTPSQIIQMASRLSAEPLEREARESLLQRVSQNGFIDDYEGVRVSSSGRRFMIRRATVWNLVDRYGQLHGQAATFSDWDLLPN